MLATPTTDDVAAAKARHKAMLAVLANVTPSTRIGSPEEWTALVAFVGSCLGSLERIDAFVRDLRRGAVATGDVAEWPTHWGS